MSAAHLPAACRHHYANSKQRKQQQPQERRRGLPKSPPTLHTITSHVDGVPPEYLYNRAIPNLQPNQMVAYTYDKQTQKVVKKTQPPHADSLPTNVTLVCLPDGIVTDCSIAGPYNDNSDDHEKSIFLGQSKKWFPSARQAQDFVERRPRVTDVPGMGVQVSGWTGFTWQHFALDTLMRLALVYESLVSDSNDDDDDDALLWRHAKIIIHGNWTGHGDDEAEIDPMVKYLYTKLNLTDRLVPNNGWLVKAQETVRFEYLVYPDVTPHYKCGDMNNNNNGGSGGIVVDPVFPRNLLRPIQTALGSTEDNDKRYIVYAGRHMNRAVDPTREKLLLEKMEELLGEFQSSCSLELKVWEYHRHQLDATMEMLRHTAILMGPHGANLWNAALIPPGGLLIEFNTWEDAFTNDDCRTYGYGLANAAGLQYALVDTEDFGYFKNGLLPRTELVVRAVRDYLTTTMTTVNNNM